MPTPIPVISDLNSLCALVCVLENGSLSQAARNLGIPKSTLSRRIRDLEQTLGQPLIRREARRLIPTEAGEVLAQYAERMLALADQGHEALRELATEIGGELLVYADNAIVRAWLTDVVDDFMTRHPSVQISMKTRTEVPIVDHHSQLHFWLGTPPKHGLRQELLASLPVGIYANPAYLAGRTPEHPDDLQQHLWIRMEGEGPELGLHQGASKRHVQRLRAHLRVDQLILLGDALARGMGMGLFPHWLARVRNQSHPDSLVPCLPGWESEAQPLWLLYPHGQMPKRLSAFLAHVRGQAPAEWQSHT